MANVSSNEAVVDAMGSNFTKFQALALMAKEQPATRAYAEGQMAKLLMAMSSSERLALRQALINAGVR